MGGGGSDDAGRRATTGIPLHYRLGDTTYRTILDSIADGLFTVDREFRITTWNRAAEAITGYSRAEAVGQFCHSILKSDICQSDCLLRSVLRTGIEVVDFPANVITHGGEAKAVTVSSAPLRGDEGKVLGGVETFRDVSAAGEARDEETRSHTFHGIVGKSEAMRGLFVVLPDVAENDNTVLVQGASGTGKGTFARVIHDLSRRRVKPFISINCAAVPDTLLDAELFGYRKGAFAEARADKRGRFELANGGTIFLDEVADLPMGVQAKLLRVLEERAFEPLGGTESIEVDVRVIAATSRPLRDQVAAGRFREDLYYRINIIHVAIPPLSERRADIPLLVNNFIAKLNRRHSRHVVGVTADALCALMAYDFPGNVRELENIIERAFILHRCTLIDTSCLPAEVAASGETALKRTGEQDLGPLESAEARAILDALARHGGHRVRTARALGIHKTTLIRKMKRLGITYP